MKNVYLIFTNPNDIYSNATVICDKEELDSVLVEAEMIDPGTTIADYNWVVFENGKMIQGYRIFDYIFSSNKKHIKIGDKVQFEIDGETFQDTIIYIDFNVIEGEKYDLTYVKNLRIVS